MAEQRHGSGLIESAGDDFIPSPMLRNHHGNSSGNPQRKQTQSSMATVQESNNQPIKASHQTLQKLIQPAAKTQNQFAKSKKVV